MRMAAELPHSERAFYFGPVSHECNDAVVLFDTSESDDGFGKALRFVRNLATVNRLQSYFLRVGAEVDRKPTARLKVGLRRDFPLSGSQAAKVFECIGPDGLLRLASFGRIEGSEYGFAEGLFNYLYGVLILSKDSEGQIFDEARTWVSVDSSSLSALNVVEMARSPSVEAGRTVVCRFFPEDNGRRASVALIGRSELGSDSFGQF